MRTRLYYPLLVLLAAVICTGTACDVPTKKVTLLFTGDAQGSIEPCG